MRSRKLLPLFALTIMLVLAGCYRQAEETFEPIDSQSSGEQTIPQDATALPEETDIPVLIIDPNAAETEEAVETEEVAETEEAVETEEIVETEEPSATLRVINPTATQAQASSTPNTIPTATEAQFITPEVNVEAVIPTATATVFVEQPTLEPTPTTLGDTPVELGECDYVVQSGDTLFRIALNNDVSLAELLEVNNLSETSIIQPEQVLIIPNCTQEAEEAVVAETEEADELTDCDYVVLGGDTLFQIALDNEISLADLLEVNDLTEASIIQPNQVLRLPNCEDGSIEEEEAAPIATQASSETIHTVASGDTLLSIARRYGVTVNDIIQANNIPNPNNLTVGQQLVIPAGEDE